MFILKVVLLDPKTVIYLLNLAVAASLVCGVGLFAARMCRHCPAPVRHGILVGTLALVLFSPGAVWLGQRSGLTWIQLAVSDQPDSSRFSEGVLLEPRPGRASMEDGSSAITGLERLSATGPARRPSAASGVSAPWKPASEAEARSQGIGDEECCSSPSVPAHQSVVCWWQVLGTMLAFGWMVGILVHVIRLAWGYRVLGRFHRCLEEVAEPRVRAVAQQAAEAVGRHDAPRVFRSPFAQHHFAWDW